MPDAGKVPDGDFFKPRKHDMNLAQLDADAIRHAAAMLDAIKITPRTEAGAMVADYFTRHQENLTAWLSEQADAIEEAKP
jgi:predicted transcriptional regulator